MKSRFKCDARYTQQQKTLVSWLFADVFLCNVEEGRKSKEKQQQQQQQQKHR